MQARKYKSFEEIPGPKGLPVIGVLHKYLPFGEHYLFTLCLHSFKKKGFKKGKGRVKTEKLLLSVEVVSGARGGGWGASIAKKLLEIY